MKAIVFLAAIFFKWSLLGVPLWVSICVLAPLAIALACWYRRLKKRSKPSPPVSSRTRLTLIISDGEDDTHWSWTTIPDGESADHKIEVTAKLPNPNDLDHKVRSSVLSAFAAS